MACERWSVKGFAIVVHYMVWLFDSRKNSKEDSRNGGVGSFQKNGMDPGCLSLATVLLQPLCYNTHDDGQAIPSIVVVVVVAATAVVNLV